MEILKISFDLLLLCKVYNVWPKKSTEELSFMTLKSDAKFEEKLTCGLEINIRKFLPEDMKNLKIGTLMGSTYPNKKMYELKIYRGVRCHGVTNDAKFEEELNCFKIDTTIWPILTRALKYLENLHFNGFLLTKAYM